jgi:hypothetical protein
MFPQSIRKVSAYVDEYNSGPYVHDLPLHQRLALELILELMLLCIECLVKTD